MKYLISRDNSKSSPKLKDSTWQHMFNIAVHILQLNVELTILRFHLVADNDGHYAAHVLLLSKLYK